MPIEKAAFAFRMNGTPVSCKHVGNGHINTTQKIVTDQGAEYVLQKINKHVFKDPVSLMNNAGAITDFIRSKVDDPRLALHFITTQDGQFYHMDEDGEFWRMYDFVGGFCLDAPESEEDFYQSALAFGRFQQMLSDFPAETLVETIPEFHNTVDRYRQFKEAVAADPMGRLDGVREEVEFLLAREERGTRLHRMREAGQLPLRVTHNDTKLNNVLIDEETQEGICIIDLDTTMPGLSIYDFGDSIRFGANHSAEDEKDLSKVNFDIDLYRIYTRGFLEGAAGGLTEAELEYLPWGAKLMTLECGIRFLTDFLDGDNYFHIHYPEQNLDRCRTQFKLVADMEAQWEKMHEIVKEIAK